MFEFLTIWNQQMDQYNPLKTATLRDADCPWLSRCEEFQKLQVSHDSARRAPTSLERVRQSDVGRSGDEFAC